MNHYKDLDVLAIIWNLVFEPDKNASSQTVRGNKTWWNWDICRKIIGDDGENWNESWLLLAHDKSDGGRSALKTVVRISNITSLLKECMVVPAEYR